MEEIKKEIHDNRMLWELWIQGGPDWKAIQKSLANRGYKNVPYFAKPKFFERKVGNQKSTLQNLKPIRTMIRRGSSN